ncbi:MAG TPA: NAD(P)/FAD-dependent oxidoreductase [Candidatus Methylomirabilis sp.]|nr:NAD(P)/FAD-dependent oxidoreductase [Candidatus Methylomirabilis sp.]
MTRTVDVLVVGIGPGGAAAAWGAATAGLEVLAVEKKKRIGEPVQCAEFIPGPLVEYARSDDVRSQAIDGMKTYLPSGTVTASAFAGLMVDRASFDRALAARAASAGAEIMSDTALVAVEPDQRVAWIRQKGQTRTIAYRVLIGADGPHSATARLLGLPALPVIHSRQYTVPLTGLYSDSDVWLSDEFPGGYAWLFPKGKLANLGLGADRRFEPDLKAALERLHAELVRQGRVGAEVLQRTGGAIPVGGLRPNLHWKHVLFVGDAAGFTHPITGAGIAAAVQSGERAGLAAAEYVAGDGGALDAYDEDMREQYGPALARAVERRAYLAGHWRQAGANDDGVQRRGWIAFNEYFA